MKNEDYVEVNINEEDEGECNFIDTDDVVVKEKKPNVFRRGWNWVKDHKAPIIAGAVGVLVGVTGKVISDLAIKAKNDGTTPLLGTSDDDNNDGWSEPEEEPEDIFEEDTSEEE